MRNCPVFAFCYTGPRKIGAIILQANCNLASGELALLIDHNKPKSVLYTPNAKEAVTGAQKLAEYPPSLFVLCDNLEKTEVPEGHVSYEEFTAGASVCEPAISFRPHIYDEVLRLCTSGTTALPKSVPVNDINEVLSAHDVIMQYPLDRNDVTLNMTPWFHRGGCHCAGPCSSFYAGACVVIMRVFKPQNVLEYVQKYSITYLMGAPANLELLNRTQEKEKHDLSKLRGIVTMGAPLTKADCIRYFETLTPKIYNGYGTTETFWNAFLRPYDLPEGAGSVGGSCIDDEVRVVKIAEGKRTEPDDTVKTDGKTNGEIIIKSPGKSAYSYIGNEELARKKWYKGWYYTGDTGTWDKNLTVTVTGRKDNMIVVSGENIYPEQVEEVLLTNPKVRECIVTSVPDKIRGQSVAAYVVPEDSTLTIEELGDFCSKSPMLSNYKRPRYFAIVDSLPKTATGKKQHYLMRQKTEEDLKNGILKRP